MTPLNHLYVALLAYCRDVLAQSADVVHQHVHFSSPFSAHIGPHVRHIIEHFDALQKALSDSGQPRVLDYDARERDTRIETEPAFALSRLLDLQQWLAGPDWCDASFNVPLAVHLRVGLQGEHNIASQSTVGRELTFLSSHAVHHFAILQGYARQEGLSFGPGLGKAPATVAFESRAVTA